MKIALRLLGHARSQAGGVLALLAALSTGVAFDLVKPWPMKLVVDSVISGHALPAKASWLSALPGGATRMSLLGWLTAATILFFLGGWAVKLGQTYLENTVGSRLTLSLGGEVFDHLQRLSLRYHNRHAAGDLVKRVMNDSNCIQTLVIGVLVPLLTAVLSLISTFFVMWQLDPALAMVAVVAAPLLAVSVRMFSGAMEQRTYRQYEIQGEVMSLSEQTLAALPVVRAFGRESHEDARFAGLCREGDRAYLGALASQLRFKVATDTIMALGTAAVMGLGGYHVLAGKLSVGSMLVFTTYLASMYVPLETLAYLSQSFAAAKAGARRVFEVLDANDHVLQPQRPMTLDSERTRGRITIEQATFGYDSLRPVLDQIDLDVRPGETVALVGSTGAGKSTLVSLIARFYDPDSGRVLLDGVDLRELDLASVRSQIAMVLQETFLFPVSVADNIGYGRPGATREEIVEAAVAANADRFIRDLPQGYDTILGERGATLSGGERQRISIARALLKNAPVLILDEPTSALDAQTEAQIMGAVERLIEGRTTLIIAHRLSTIRRATRIAVMEHGKVIEIGSHAELLARDGQYARLYHLQSGRARSATEALQ